MVSQLASGRNLLDGMVNILIYNKGSKVCMIIKFLEFFTDNNKQFFCNTKTNNLNGEYTINTIESNATKN